MFTITETITTEAGIVIARSTTQTMTEEMAMKKVLEIHDRNDAIGLINGRTYVVEMCEPGQTPMHLIGAVA